LSRPSGKLSDLRWGMALGSSLSDLCRRVSLRSGLSDLRWGAAFGGNIREGGRGHEKSAAEQSDAKNLHFCLLFEPAFGLLHDDRK
jgi:hypothetical protein